jgi:hypothetical protein
MQQVLNKKGKKQHFEQKGKKHHAASLSGTKRGEKGALQPRIEYHTI